MRSTTVVLVALVLCASGCGHSRAARGVETASPPEAAVRVDLIWLNDYPHENLGLVDIPADRQALDGRWVVVRGVLVNNSWYDETGLVAGLSTPIERSAHVLLEPGKDWMALEWRLVEAVGRLRMVEDRASREAGVAMLDPINFVLEAKSVRPLD
jgi:hypothetical protein